MIILAIETSCDDTCLALIKATGKKWPHFKILSNIISSQVELHKKWGGVYPTLAKREHQKNLPLILKKVLSKTKSTSWRTKINLMAVTIGPGLEPCLWTGVNFAKELVKKWKLPMVPVNHIEAHIYANFLSLTPSSIRELFPAVCLIVSGGHTQLILMKNQSQYKILGETRDDAAGECFDKVARILGLGYPGGPVIAVEAARYNKKNNQYRIRLPRPMIYQKNYDFSFSGLKTAVLYNFKSQISKVRKSKKYIQAICTEAQQAIIDVLILKTIKAAKEYKVKTIILGGGVSANIELRNQFQKKIKKDLPNTKYLAPDLNYCTDNAVMVAVTAYYHWLKGKRKNWGKIKAKANLKLA